MTSISSAFNNHAKEFFTDVKNVLPNDPDVLAAELAVEAAKKANVTLFIKAWRKYTDPYAAKIKEKDISFFLEKDYTAEVMQSKKPGLTDVIERMRQRLATLPDEHQVTIMEYVFNLTTLSLLYASQTT
jgi:hypothetical protein